MPLLDEPRAKALEQLTNIYGPKRVELRRTQVEAKLRNMPILDHAPLTDYDLRKEFNDILYPKGESLHSRYLSPPYSILNTTDAKWLARRRELNEMLGASTGGRAENLTQGKVFAVREDDTGTSQFDAALTEIIYRWFSKPGDEVYDPFAGGHVRGTVATYCGRKYTGIELSTEQVEENRRVAEHLEYQVTWHNDDSKNAEKYTRDMEFDLLFTCPPYYDLEEYDSGDGDLSMLGTYDEFLLQYAEIFRIGAAHLKPNRFAVVVIGDLRDEKGFLRNLPNDTVRIFKDLGFGLYNTAILQTSVGSAAFRAPMYFPSRKLVGLHQYVLVFYRGDTKKIKERLGLEPDLPPKKATEQVGLFG